MSKLPFAQWMLVLVGIAALNVSAKLGETEEQSRQRYGEPLKKPEDVFRYQPILDGAVNLTYKFQGWWIRSAYVHGKTVRISYVKMNKPDVNPAIQDNELQAVLESEADGGKWQAKSNGTFHPDQFLDHTVGHLTTWINTNGDTARLDATRLQLVFESPAAADFIAARDAEQELRRNSNTAKF
jgi:hypothetical protein